MLLGKARKCTMLDREISRWRQTWRGRQTATRAATLRLLQVRTVLIIVHYSHAATVGYGRSAIYVAVYMRDA